MDRPMRLSTLGFLQREQSYLAAKPQDRRRSWRKSGGGVGQPFRPSRIAHDLHVTACLLSDPAQQRPSTRPKDGTKVSNRANYTLQNKRKLAVRPSMHELKSRTKLKFKCMVDMTRSEINDYHGEGNTPTGEVGHYTVGRTCTCSTQYILPGSKIPYTCI